MELISQSCTREGVFDGEVFLTHSRSAVCDAVKSDECSDSAFEFVHDIRSIAFVSEVSE